MLDRQAAVRLIQDVRHWHDPQGIAQRRMNRCAAFCGQPGSGRRESLPRL